MNIITELPGITPTARPYTMGQWPQARKKMRNGRVARWPLSARPSGDKMELVWQNITYTEAEQLSKVWDENYGIYGRVILPPEIFAGTSGELRTFLAMPFPGATWHFVGSPQITAVKAGRCTMRMPIGVRGSAVYEE
jgi:hypothetical protein